MNHRYLTTTTTINTTAIHPHHMNHYLPSPHYFHHHHHHHHHHDPTCHLRANPISTIFLLIQKNIYFEWIFFCFHLQQ